MIKIIMKNARVLRSGIVFNFEGKQYFVKRTYLDNHVEVNLGVLEGATLLINSQDVNATKDYIFINRIEGIELIDSQNNTKTKIETTQIEDVQYKEIKKDFYNIKQEEFHTFQKGLFFHDLRIDENFRVKINNLSNKRVSYDSEISVIQNFISSGNSASFLGLTKTSSLAMVSLLEVVKYDIDEDLFISIGEQYDISVRECLDEIFKIIEMFDSIFKKEIYTKLSWMQDSIIQKVNNINNIIIGTEDNMLLSLEGIKDKSLNPSFISKKQVEYKTLTKEVIDKIAAYAFHAQGIKELKEEQFTAIEKLLLGKGNILAVLKTGFGKSLIYQLFSFMQPVIILAVFPINALIDDQNIHLNSNGFDFSMSNSEIKKNKNIIDEKTLANKRLFLITAERLENIDVNSMLKSLANFIGAIVFDEAHCISEWGHDFRPSYLVVRHVMQNIKEKNDKMKIIALTATAAPYIQKDIMNILNINSRGLINLADGSGLERKELKYRLIKEKDTHLKRISDKKRFWGDVAVQVAQQQEQEDGVSILYFIYANKWNSRFPNLASAEHAFEESGINNSGLFTGSKKEIMDMDGDRVQGPEFNKFKQTNVLFATKSFGMGVNIEDCNYVGLIQPPASLEDLYQQAGRAGRRGQDSLVEIRYSDSHLVDPMQKSSPFEYFLSNDKVRMGIQPLLVDELLQLIEENEFKDLVINVKQLYNKFLEVHKEKCSDKKCSNRNHFKKNNFDNYLKWSIAHLINEFAIIDYYVVYYGYGMSLSTIRIFINKSNQETEDIDERISKTLSNYAIENFYARRIDEIKAFYEFYFAEIEKQKKTGINIFVNELKEIDKKESFDSNEVINKSINNYYRTRSESNYTFADKYYGAMEDKADLSTLERMIRKALTKQSEDDLNEVLSRYAIAQEYTMITSVLLWYEFSIDPIIDSIENILQHAYKNQYLISIMDQIMKRGLNSIDKSSKLELIKLASKNSRYAEVCKTWMKIKVMEEWND